MLIFESATYQIYQYQVGQLQTNCYFLIYRPTGETWIIDPGDDGEFLSEEILRLQIQPHRIVLTHGHFDHVGAVLVLKLNFDLPIYLNFADQAIYQKTPDSASFWQGITFDPPPPPDHDLSKTPQLFFTSTTSHSTSQASSKTKPSPSTSETNWQVITTPGHTPGAICLYSSTQKILFSGDTLFAQDIGRTDFSYSSPSKMLTSLQTLINLPDQTLVLPGHGQSTTIGQEKTIISHN